MAKQLVRPRVYMDLGLIAPDSRRLRKKQALHEAKVIKKLSKMPIELVLLSERNKRSLQVSEHIAEMFEHSWIVTEDKFFKSGERKVRWHVPAIDADQAESPSPFVWAARNISVAESTRIQEDYRGWPRLVLGAHPTKGLDCVALFHMNSFTHSHPPIPAAALPDLSHLAALGPAG